MVIRFLLNKYRFKVILIIQLAEAQMALEMGIQEVCDFSKVF